MLRRTIQFASLFLLATCAGTAEMPEAPRVAMPDADAAWSFDTVAAELADASCPAGTAPAPSVPISITAHSIDLGPAEEVARRLPDGATFAGGWELTADNASFGGLSDLALDSNGDLLAVVDDGDRPPFVVRDYTSFCVAKRGFDVNVGLLNGQVWRAQ